MTGYTFGENLTSLIEQPGLIVDDNFNNGAAGWTQLLDRTKPTGIILLDSEITYGNSRYSLLMQTENQTDTEVNSWGSAMAIKRMYQPNLADSVYMDFYWSWASTFGQNTPRAIDFGLDQCSNSGQRQFFKVRWKNFDETTGQRVHQWQINNNSDVFQDIPGATVDCGYNENKRNLYRLECVFDLKNHHHSGVRINGIGFGSLAETPDNSLNSVAPAVETLQPFANGFNPIVQIRNNLQTNNCKCWVNLGRVRALSVANAQLPT